MDEKLRYAFYFLVFYLLFMAFISYAEEPDNQIRLSLQECVSLALESNLNVRIQRIDPRIQGALLTKAKGSFDPSASFSPTISKSEEPSSTPFLTGADVRTSKSRGVSLGINDPIVTGGSYSLSFDSNRSESNSELQTLNPAYRSGLTLNVTQPLLDGFGIGVNRSSITIARNNQDMSILRLKAQLIGTLSEVQDAYWGLVFELENLKVQELALKQAEDLLAINRQFKEVGKATLSDILQAQAAVASREADVIDATDSVKDAEDNLKRVTNIIQDEALWDAAIVPVDAPTTEEVGVDLEESVAAALKNRPEYAQAELDLQNSDIYVKVAKNQRLPTLDLEGSYTLNGLGGDVDEPLSQVGGADYKSWFVGLALRMPLGERGARADLKRSQFEKEQKLLALKDLEQQIIADVRGAVRQLETDRKRIEATKAAEDLAEQVLKTEEEKYNLGLSTSYELLQFQASLATATKNRLRAVTDYRKSIVYLNQALGITLENLDIKMEE
jgi:outer membrane protein TolC